MRPFYQLGVNRPWTTLFITLVLSALATWQIVDLETGKLRLRVDPSPNQFLPQEDEEIRKTYTPEFLEVHKASMEGAIPDLYLKGQGEYFDELRTNLSAADAGTKTPREALDDTARSWDRITRRMGKRSQAVQWGFLKSIYPEAVRDRLV